jgi:prevent-host-death family protein
MSQFNVAEAKSHFSDLLRKALRGEEVVIARDGKPLVRLVPVDRLSVTREPGSARGEIWMAPDFDETPEDFKEYVR